MCTINCNCMKQNGYLIWFESERVTWSGISWLKYLISQHSAQTIDMTHTTGTQQRPESPTITPPSMRLIHVMYTPPDILKIYTGASKSEVEIIPFWNVFL